jgi:hypothetical protein
MIDTAQRDPILIAGTGRLGDCVRGTCSCRVLRNVAGDLYEASKYYRSVFSHFSISGKYHSLQVEKLDTDDR